MKPDSRLKSIIDEYESNGLIIINLSQEELLDRDRPMFFVHRETIYPPVRGFLRLLSAAYAAHVESNGLKIDAAKEMERFGLKYKLPEDFCKVYDLPSMTPELPKKVFIEIISNYKMGLERRMNRQGFSSSYRNKLCLVTDEMLTNAFQHGNGGDISKDIFMNEIYMRARKKHGYVNMVQDSGVNLLTKEDIDTHRPQIDPSTGKPKLTSSKRGFAIIDGLSNRSWALPYELGNTVAAHLFERSQNSQ